MNKSHWLILVFVAVMVCNGSCRPRETNDGKIYPVYRPVKQLELETPNRYEKPNKEKQSGDSVTYHRIDIPYKNHFKTTENLAVKNNSKLVIEYVPVALTVKKTNVKKWPSDQNGIESPDDLSLYNNYTHNINPLNTHESIPFSPITQAKPSILIIDGPSTHRPFHDSTNNIFTRPIHVDNKPFHHTPFDSQNENPNRPVDIIYPYPDEEPHYQYPSSPPYVGSSEYDSKPENVDVNHVVSEYPINVIPSHNHGVDYGQNPVNIVPPQHHNYGDNPSNNFGYVSTTFKPETATKKKVKNTKCPNVSIIATTSINNNNSVTKEGCQDITIHINTNLNNMNVGATKPTKPPSNPGVQDDESGVSQSGGSGLLEFIWVIISRIFSFNFTNPLFNTMLAPFSAILAGGVSLSALILPWIFPHLFWSERNRHKSTFGIRKNYETKAQKNIYGSVEGNSHYVKRTKRYLRGLQVAYMGWNKGKKISRYR